MLFDHYEVELWYLLDIFIACILSGAIGYERAMHQKPAGFRTQMIIGGASALFVKVSQAAVNTFAATHKDVLDVDPIRIIQAIVIGIGFIGGGSIIKLRKEKDVAYLTTAATILFSAAIGISVGLRQYILSVGVTILVIVINHLAGRIGPE